MSGIDDLLSVARAYGAAEEIPLKTVSWRALGDTKKLDRLVAGFDIGTRRQETALQWFSDNWPDAGRWPDDVDRPAPSPPSSTSDSMADDQASAA